MGRRCVGLRAALPITLPMPALMLRCQPEPGRKRLASCSAAHPPTAARPEYPSSTPTCTSRIGFRVMVPIDAATLRHLPFTAIELKSLDNTTNTLYRGVMRGHASALLSACPARRRRLAPRVLFAAVRIVIIARSLALGQMRFFGHTPSARAAIARFPRQNKPFSPISGLQKPATSLLQPCYKPATSLLQACPTPAPNALPHPPNPQSLISNLPLAPLDNAGRTPAPRHLSAATRSLSSPLFHP